MAIPLSSLRQDIYSLVDRVLETGEPLEITRKGRTLRIIPDAPVDRVSRITPIAGLIAGDPAELVSIDWSGAWDAEANT
ncbi:MAG: type II toxin-antitoxin system prevent-host-death family antitoxin [Protaetiibacter sp.]